MLAKALADLGYAYRPGPSGDPADLLLRQTADPQKGFEWKGQENYDAVGEAAVGWIQSQLGSLCGLECLPLPRTKAESHTAVWGSPGLLDHTDPLLILVCGSEPGGAPGVWGRSLCINVGLKQGAMFDYIFRAQKLGWAVLVANPNVNTIQGKEISGSECPHLHLTTLWKDYVEPSKASRILMVAHSYGGPGVVHLLKAEANARERLAAAAFTDGTAFGASPMTMEVVPKGVQDAMLIRWTELAPAAFAPPSGEVISCLRAVCRNYVRSSLPPGTPIAAERDYMPALSSGHENHPATTHAATEPVFAFLERGAAGEAAAANDEVRAKAGPAKK